MVRLTATLKRLLKKIKKHEAQKHAMTPMPRLLMHWWTPLILAIILLQPVVSLLQFGTHHSQQMLYRRSIF